MPAKRAVQRPALHQPPGRQTPTGQFAARDAALGYLYQVRLALLLLLKVGVGDPETAVAIELLDDVEFETNGTPVELIQAKHHQKGLGSLSDSSSDLWKTIRVWSELLRERQLDPSSTLLALMTTGTAPADSIASWLRPERTRQRDPEAALQRMRSVANASTSGSNAAAYDAFRSLTPAQQELLVEAIRVLDQQSDIAGLQEEATRQLIYAAHADHLEAVYQRLEGWWFQTVIQHLLGRSHDPIPHQMLAAKLGSIREEFQHDNLPNDYPEPLELSVAALGKTQRVFVEQLKLVSVGHRRLQFAISDYYRAFHQRSRWLRDELLPPSDLETYEKRLINEWERQFEIMREGLRADATEDEKQVEGRKLFNWTDKVNYPIRPRCVDPYISRGSFHMLANQLRVGWHTDYSVRLGKTTRKRVKEKTC